MIVLGVTVSVGGRRPCRWRRGPVGQPARPADDSAEILVSGVTVPPAEVATDHAGLGVVGVVMGPVEGEVAQGGRFRGRAPERFGQKESHPSEQPPTLIVVDLPHQRPFRHREQPRPHRRGEPVRRPLPDIPPAPCERVGNTGDRNG